MIKDTITFIGLDTHKQIPEVVTINDHQSFLLRNFIASQGSAN